MKNISRLTVAAVVAAILVVIATGVWAAPAFRCTVPVPPDEGESVVTTGCVTDPIDMGTALFIPACNSAAKVVALQEPGVAPEGLAFVGDAFNLSIEPQDTTSKVCYAYPPELAKKDAKIYKLNEMVTPKAWVEVPGAVVGDGKICVTSTSGAFALIGKP